MNAKEEFLRHTERTRKRVYCATLSFGDDYDPGKQAHLTVGYNSEQYKEFLHNIDEEYDEGYGGQELYGTIWYEDMTWSSRREYDGQEWWVYNKCPEIPFHLWKEVNKEDGKIQDDTGSN